MKNKLIHEKNIQVEGFLTLYEGDARDIVKDSNGNIISYTFENRKLVGKTQNVICNGFFQLLSAGWTLPCAIAIGNGDNGSIDANNAPKQADIKLNREVDQGRFICLDRTERFNQVSGIATFNSLYPSNAFSEEVTEWGLFAGTLNSVAINSKDSGFLVARRAEPYTKDPDKAVDVVWTIGVTLN
jgi:hypothetical protein